MNQVRSLLPLLFTVLFVCSGIVFGEISLPAVISDHMVLQQQEEVAFWGEYTPNEEVTVSGSWGKEATAVVDDIGNWSRE